MRPLAELTKCAVRQVAKRNRNSDKLGTNWHLDFEMFLYCTHYCYHQIQAKRQARLVGCWQIRRVQSIISATMAPPLTYKSLLALVAILKPHPLHSAGFLAFTDPQTDG